MIKGLVVTGPTGAIGMALINKCIEDNIPVLAICHKGSARIKQIPENVLVTVVEAGLNEYDKLDVDILAGQEYDTFIHLAWNGTFGNTRNDMKLQSDNIKYALDAVELAHRLGCKCFVGAGSQAEYGRVSEPLGPDTPAFPENGYGIAKLAAGKMTRIRCEQLGIKHIWTRILSVYGPYDGDYTMVMSTLNKMLAGEETHFTAGDQIWNYLYSEDAADIMMYLANNGDDGSVYCLGSEEAKPLKDYITVMHAITECNGRLGLGDIPYAAGQVMCLCMKESPVSGYTFTEFPEGIKKTIAWIKDKSLES